MTLNQLLVSSIALLGSFAAAQFPPEPQGLTIKDVTSHPGVSISYKETCICETKAKAWAGYVHMPASYLSDIEGSDPYNISMFFWYFEAREDPQNAPTVIYLAGGPGQSSLWSRDQMGLTLELDGATGDGGPCTIGEDSNSTIENPWSMNNKANTLFIDQPVGVGYSYDALVKSVQDLLFIGEPAQSTGITPLEAYGDHVPSENTTFRYGMFPTQNYNRTANTTGLAAVTLWHFSQVWFSEFPEWTTTNKKVGMWGNSYAGYWVPASAAYFQKQNGMIRSGDISGTIIEIDNIGVTNGCIDTLYQAEWYPQMAYNNTYGFQAIPKKVYEKALDIWSKKGGARDSIQQCRALADAYDPNDTANNATVNLACNAAALATLKLLGIFSSKYSLGQDRSAQDMAHKLPDPFPPQYTIGFFNQEWVQRELGSPVNFSANSLVSENIILSSSGDPIRREGLKDIEYLLHSGVKVALAYGDRDQRCPWLGGEYLSLAAQWAGSEGFNAAGYAYVQTNDSYNGGIVRQHGNLSFSRIFEAGHDPAPYQPETVYRIFDRTIFNTDVATGQISVAGSHNDYSTHGPSSSYAFKGKLPPPPPVNCALESVSSTCTWDQYYALGNGTAEIVDFRVVKPVGGGGFISVGAGF